MKAQVFNDLVISIVHFGRFKGPSVPDSLAALPMTQLRYNGEQVIDAAKRDKFAIDDAGNKRLPEMADASWQIVKCQFSDELVKDGNKWKVAKP